MTAYADTSVLVTGLTDEARAPEVFKWLEEPSTRAGGVMISDWTITEVSSALALRVRTGAINDDRKAAALAAFQRIADESLEVAPIVSGMFRAAAGLAGQPGLVLRAGDALHLAIVLDHGATLCTLDRRLAAAASRLGVALVGPRPRA